jgi:dynein heavy chain 1
VIPSPPPSFENRDSCPGKLDINTREWSDGIFTAVLRRIVSSANSSQRHWIVFDGDLDPNWVESLNSVLDDNKTLTLPSGERLELPPNVRIIFEVGDIGYGTPATVSRCGMVWFAETTVQVDDLLQRYIAVLHHRPFACVASEVVGESVSFPQSVSSMQVKVVSILEPFFVRGGFLSSAVKLSQTYNHIMPIRAIQACSNVVSLLMRFIDSVSCVCCLSLFLSQHDTPSCRH